MAKIYSYLLIVVNVSKTSCIPFPFADGKTYRSNQSRKRSDGLTELSLVYGRIWDRARKTTILGPKIKI